MNLSFFIAVFLLMKQAKYLLLVLSVFLANCKSPVSPQGTPKITFFSPKDTTLTDSLHIIFHFNVENSGHANLGLQWNFSDGKNESTNTTIGIHDHFFPSLGNYTFKIVLIDTNSKVVFDTLSGSVHILESPPTLAELQQMKYCKVQVYCPTNNGVYFFDIDPLVLQDLTISPYPVDILGMTEGKIYWNEYRFKMNQYKKLKYDTTGYLGGEIFWNITGVVNEKNTTIDSFILDHEFHNRIPWFNHVPMEMSLSKQANIVSIPFVQRIADSLIFQELNSDSLRTLKKIYYGGDNGYQMPPPFNFSGPIWNSLHSESYVRIILYK